MAIAFSNHAREQMKLRGAAEDEVQAVIERGPREPALRGKLKANMKITYDPAVDAVYIEFHPLEPGRAEARPLTDKIIANYGPDGQLAGLEILDASRVLRSPEDAGRVIFEVVPLLTPQPG